MSVFVLEKRFEPRYIGFYLDFFAHVGATRAELKRVSHPPKWRPHKMRDDHAVL